MFLLSKITQALLQPGALLTFATIFAALLAWRRHPAARPVAVALAAGALGLSILPVGYWALAPLEYRFPQAAGAMGEPFGRERIDGIIVLGGYVDPHATQMHGQLQTNGDVERFLAFMALARQYPQAKLIATGGSGSVIYPDTKESMVVRRMVSALGAEQLGVLYEERSRNTYENATYSHALAQPRAGEQWVLITSARHIPRAMGVFRGVGWPGLIPYPVDYLTLPDSAFALGWSLTGNLWMLRAALHEWLGLSYYRLRGFSPEWLPGP